MIVAEQKPISEIKEMVVPYRKLLVLGCGTCVQTCFAGGEDEVAALVSTLRLAFKMDGTDIEVEGLTIERQCEDEFIQEAAEGIARNDAVLSLACGAGVQAIARRFYHTPVLPGVNTTFIGVLEKQGLFTEECLGCGNCELATFNGICPIARCAKKLLNGPCGGSRDGKCEIWQLIYERSKALGKLDSLKTYHPARSWQASSAGGPRRLVREDHII